MNHTNHINWLVELAAQNTPAHRARVVAAVVYRGRTITVRANSIRTDPFHAKYSQNQLRLSIHAETAAIKAALKVLNLNDLERCTLYVARAKLHNGKFVPGLAKPCIGCQRAIASFRFNRVIYSVEPLGWSEL